jgi:predicted transcriptional regulator
VDSGGAAAAEMADLLDETHQLIAVLFGVTVPTVNEHLKNLFSDGEIQENSVVRKFRTTAAAAKQYLTAFYNLDAIIPSQNKPPSPRC